VDVGSTELEPLAVGRNVVADDKGRDGDEQPDTEATPMTAMAAKPTAVSSARGAEHAMGVRTSVRYPAGQM
jgi:hypothetical protein